MKSSSVLVLPRLLIGSHGFASESVGQQLERANIRRDRLLQIKLTSTTANSPDRVEEQGSSGLCAQMVTDHGAVQKAVLNCGSFS